LCGNKDCGTDAMCVITNGTSECQCSDGFIFSEFDKTCVYVCENKDCGTAAKCVVVASNGTTECQCLDGTTFSDSDKTCVDLCANKDCGTTANAKCVVANGSAECQCWNGFIFRESDKTCDGGPYGTKDCGEGICSVGKNGTAECRCLGGLIFDQINKTCYDPCARKDCGDGVCSVGLNGTAECGCLDSGLIFDQIDKTCYGPFLRTTVQLQVKDLLGYVENLDFETSVPAERASGTTTCSDLSFSFNYGGDTMITVAWDDSSVAAAGIGMCKSVMFHDDPGCADKPGLTIVRPAMVGRFYPVTERTVKATDLPKSVGCEITTCHKDCGTAECVVKEGKPQCKCPWGFAFIEAERTCINKSFTPESDPCKAGMVKCDKNSKCVVKNGQGMCECDAGYTKKNGLCTAICNPACPVNAQCTVVGGNLVCRCKQGFKMEKSKCI
ncbi:unnamed protein product, partial [Closterium sp. Naga37s-1]